MNNKNATAVTMTENGSCILATAKEGLFVRRNTTWYNTLPHLRHTIRDFTCSDNVVYGAGDNGIFIRSINDGEDWTVKQFPTKATVWNICCNAKGLVIGHGEHVIYISTNWGESWSIIHPFPMANPPSIRSLSLYKNKLFIGTKIHRKHGGVWMLDLLTKDLIRIKDETKRMISSMLVYNGVLLAASGACHDGNGTVELLPLHHLQHDYDSWELCCSPNTQRSYLHICADKGVLYATSSQNELGYSTVYRIYIDMLQLVPCDFVKGHGWRICNAQENYVVAGMHETRQYEKHSKLIC